MSKRVLCKFYANGACLKGDHCEYSHDWTTPANNICTFYQKGLCAYGSRCRYQHVKASRSQFSGSSSATSSHHHGNNSSNVITSGSDLSASSTAFVLPTQPIWKPVEEQYDFGDIGELRSVRPEDRAICSFAAAGDCPRGEKCPHIHGDLCPTCAKNCLHPFRPEEREEHLRSCEKRQKQLEALKHSQEMECCVCLERVLSKPTLAERKFGLLSECDHPFCISCIRNWRSSSPTSGLDVDSALRACPVCRKLSYFVVPSVIWFTTKDEKQEIVDSYKLKLKSIDCKHFDFGNGNCPFGTSCFYKHTVKRGSYVWKYHRPPPRRPTSRRSDVFGDMNNIIEMFDFEYLEDMDSFSPEDFDSEDIDGLSPFQMDFLFSQMGFDDTSDSSGDEESFLYSGID